MKTLSTLALRENIEQVTDFLNAALEAEGCHSRAQTQIDIATDEILSNIAGYAYPDHTGRVEVRLDFEGEPKTAVITFVDWGIPFDPLSQKSPDISAPAEERSIGGLGIFVVKKMMDAVNYEYTDGSNRLTIRKRM